MNIWASIGQNFAKILLVLFLVSGIFWVLDKVFFAKPKKARQEIVFENAGAYTYSTNLFGLQKLPIKIV